jgi:hypothetical protein
VCVGEGGREGVSVSKQDLELVAGGAGPGSKVSGPVPNTIDWQWACVMIIRPNKQRRRMTGPLVRATRGAAQHYVHCCA